MPQIPIGIQVVQEGASLGDELVNNESVVLSVLTDNIDAWGSDLADEIAATLVANFLSEIRGPQGDEGPQGARGERGARGPAGEDGLHGDIGPRGPQGARGPAGADGNDGADGADGADGDMWSTEVNSSIAYPAGANYSFGGPNNFVNHLYAGHIYAGTYGPRNTTTSAVGAWGNWSKAPSLSWHIDWTGVTHEPGSEPWTHTHGLGDLTEVNVNVDEGDGNVDIGFSGIGSMGLTALERLEVISANQLWTRRLLPIGGDRNNPIEMGGTWAVGSQPGDRWQINWAGVTHASEPWKGDLTGVTHINSTAIADYLNSNGGGAEDEHTHSYADITDEPWLEQSAWDNWRTGTYDGHEHSEYLTGVPADLDGITSITRNAANRALPITFASYVRPLQGVDINFGSPGNRFNFFYTSNLSVDDTISFYGDSAGIHWENYTSKGGTEPWTDEGYLTAVPAELTGITSINDTPIDDILTDNDTVYNDTALAGRVTVLEEAGYITGVPAMLTGITHINNTAIADYLASSGSWTGLPNLVNRNLIPDDTNRNLGGTGTGEQWNQAWVTTTYTGVLRDVNGAEILTGHHLRPTVTLENDLGEPDKRYRNLYAGSTVISSLKPVLTSVELFGHLIPDENNERDLGSSGERYKDVWGNVGKFYTLGAFGAGEANVLGLTGPVKMLDNSSLDMNQANVTYSNAPWQELVPLGTIQRTDDAVGALAAPYNSSGYSNWQEVWDDVDVVGFFVNINPLIPNDSVGLRINTLEVRSASFRTADQEPELFAARIFMYPDNDINSALSDFNDFDAYTLKLEWSRTSVRVRHGRTFTYPIAYTVYAIKER